MKKQKVLTKRNKIETLKFDNVGVSIFLYVILNATEIVRSRGWTNSRCPFYPFSSLHNINSRKLRSGN